MKRGGERPTVGVRVSHAAHRDVTLFFDRQTSLLVKTVARGTAGTDVEGEIVTELAGHQAVQRPMRMMTSHNGRPLYSHWVQEYRFPDAPEQSLFAEPTGE